MSASARIGKIAELAQAFNSVCDIGADHGYAIIALSQAGVTRLAATDINAAPLERARKNFASLGLNVETRLGDGLAPISPGEFECCVISGMGGRLISEIIQKGLNTAKRFKRLILSPQRDVAYFRRFLAENGFAITDEFMIKETKFYNILTALYSGVKESFTETELFFGRILLNKRCPVLKEFLIKEISKFENIPAKAEYSDLCKRATEVL